MLSPEETGEQPQQDGNDVKKEPQKATKRSYRSDYNMIPDQIISNNILQDLTELLDQDAKSCYDGLQEFENLANTGIPDHFRSIYELFDTVPVLFLSLDRSPEGVVNAIYLWQINKFCPWHSNNNSIGVDLTLIDTDLYAHPSFLMLLKIEPKEEETLTSAKLLSGGRLLVKSIVGDSQVMFRTYNVSDFYASAKINPYKKMINKNPEYSSMLILERGDENIESDWKVMLYRPMTSSELDTTIQEVSLNETLLETDSIEKTYRIINNNKLIESKEMENSGELSQKNVWSGAQIYTFGDHIVFFDKKNAKVIKFNLESLEVVCIRELGVIEVVEVVNESLFVVSRDEKIFQLTFAEGVNIKTIEQQSPLPPNSISTETNNTWKFIHLLDPSSSEPVLHAIFQRENKFYKLPLDQTKQGVQILLKNSDNVTINRDWDLFTYVEDSDTVNLKIPILVYISGYSICFYDVLNRREKSAPLIMLNQPGHPKYRLVKATIGRAYLHLESTTYEPAGVFEFRYPEDLDELFAGGDIATYGVRLNEDQLVGNASSADVFIQAEGDKKKITLVKFRGSQAFYGDEINCIYLAKLSLINLQKQRQTDLLKKAAAKAIHPPKEEEESKQDITQKVVQKTAEAKKNLAQADSRKEDILERVAQRINTIKQNLLSKDPKHIEIETYNDLLYELRKEIGPVVSKLFKESQERARTAQKRLGEAESMILWQSNRYRDPKPTIAPELNEDGLDISLKVSDEYLQAYKDIKAAKKKAVKHREKLKGKV